MHTCTNNMFAELAVRVRNGDGEARERFRIELERSLTHLVWHTLRRGCGATPLARCILAEAKRVNPWDDFDTVEDQTEFVLDVIRGVSAGIMARMLRVPSRRFAGAETCYDPAGEDSCVAV